MALMLIGAFFVILGGVALLWAFAGAVWAGAIIGVALAVGMTVGLVYLWKRMGRAPSP